MEKHLENVGIVKGVPQRPTEMKSAVVTINPDNNLGKVEIMKERKNNFGQFTLENSNLSSENLLDLYQSQQRLNNSSYSNSSSSPVTSPVGVSGSLKPPAYRSPPPAPKIAATQNQKTHDFGPIFSNNNDILMQNVQYRDLVQLIKYQRDKISTQQNDLTKVSFKEFQNLMLNKHFVHSLMLKLSILRAKVVNRFSIWKPFHLN